MPAASPSAEFLKHVLMVAAVVLGALVLWRTYEILLLVFASALLATVLRALAEFVGRYTRLPDLAAYAVAIVVTLALLGGAFWIFGAHATAQVNALAERLPQALASLRGWLDSQPWLRPIAESFQPGDQAGSLAARLGGFAMASFDVAAGLVLILFGGLYFGAQPGLYHQGVKMLFPPRLHGQVGDALDLAGYAMRRWLLGQLVDMATVGLLTGIGLWAIGAPSPLALGLLSGLASFVPYIGPIAAGALAVLVASAQSLELGAWTLALYLGVQQVEGHLIMPFVQRWTIALPPALGVFAVVAMGYLLGPLGVILATPLTLVVFVLVKKLYLQDTLHERVPIKE